ncbi:aminodeoxychorismate lyase [Pseudoalteromonas sp. NBT06-2]|uniref:aminodeoxychorismate lyase n=1 Tax=Pseudoalteromonas sp. NBT06-2 TaxID=2025950 RepID=UPI000BA52828|nr:aminodeoxychorismate lyase [Pseudoalteromonas sp. NBT06-2]PAJ74220.1 aminodeoxychorismate lyase [Pseudoalteromonas sp. NBT06-2]
MTTKINSYTTITNTDSAHSIPLTDRGLNYGDGFFTTTKVIKGTIAHWHFHKLRLVECQSRLGFPEINFNRLEQSIKQLCLGQKCAVLKITITRGSGGRGYGQPLEQNPVLILSLLSYPNHYDALKFDGIALEVSSIKLGLQPLLAGMKTLNRLEQVLIKQEITENAWSDTIVLDLNNNVIETSIANLIYYVNGQWFTPKLDQAGIKGVYREYLASKIQLIESKITLNDLKKVPVIFCCNSLMGLVPIKSIQNTHFDLELALKLQKDMLIDTKDI